MHQSLYIRCLHRCIFRFIYLTGISEYSLDVKRKPDKIQIQRYLLVISVSLKCQTYQTLRHCLSLPPSPESYSIPFTSDIRKWLLLCNSHLLYYSTFFPTCSLSPFFIVSFSLHSGRRVSVQFLCSASCYHHDSISPAPSPPSSSPSCSPLFWKVAIFSPSLPGSYPQPLILLMTDKWSMEMRRLVQSFANTHTHEHAPTTHIEAQVCSRPRQQIQPNTELTPS